MEEAELAQLRAQRMAEMQAQGGGGPGGGGGGPGGAGGQNKEKQSAEESKNMMLASILDMSARTRLNSIKVVKPEKAAMVENMLISMARSGQIRGKITEEQLKGFLEQVNERMAKKTKIRFARREMDEDEEEESEDTDSDEDD